MILGLDHIALSVGNLGEALASLDGERLFELRGIPNPPEKGPILAHHQASHDLALVRPSTGPRLELTCHGPGPAGPAGPYSIAVGGLVRLACPDPVGERDFWIRGLSFAPGATSSSARLARPVAAWSCDFDFAVGPDASRSTLDAPGHACAAFLVSSLEKDLAQAVAAGAHRETPAFRMVVNGNDLTIAFFRSPCGALVEFVQMERKSP